MKKTKIAIVQDMLDRYIGEDLETDRFVAEMAILMLDTVEQKQKENAAGGAIQPLETAQPEIKPDPEDELKRHETEKDQEEPQKKAGRKPFDDYEMVRLLEAGADITQIARAMDVTEQTVRNHLKKKGIKYTKL